MTQFLLSPLPWWGFAFFVIGLMLWNEHRRDKARENARAERLAEYAERQRLADVERAQLEQQYRLPSAVGYPDWRVR